MPAASTRTARTDAPAETARPEAAPKSGRWIALANLSIGRGPEDKEKQADIVHRGETVTLTEEQAQGFLRRHRVPVIRPVSEKGEPLAAITARDLFGKRPTAAQFGALPDPAGSSHVIERPDPSDPANAPEANDPQTDLTIDPDAAKDK